MKLEAKNLGFCIKLFNYVILFVQATYNASAGYMPVYIVFLFTQCCYIHNKLRVAVRFKIICYFDRSGSHVLYYMIKTIPCDAKLREKKMTASKASCDEQRLRYGQFYFKM